MRLSIMDLLFFIQNNLYTCASEHVKHIIATRISRHLIMQLSF